MPLEKLTGQVFERLTVLQTYKTNPTMWLCKCLCGKELYVRSSTMKSGVSKSCGCLQKEKASFARKTHGMKNTPEWKTWSSMKSRCKSTSKDAKRYFNRGIKVCNRWESFENFYSDMGNKPKGMSIERVNNDKGYEPENCIWADRFTQSRNTRKNKFIDFDGVVKTQSEWSIQFQISETTIMRRLKAGWSVKDSLTKLPKRKAK